MEVKILRENLEKFLNETNNLEQYPNLETCKDLQSTLQYFKSIGMNSVLKIQQHDPAKSKNFKTWIHKYYNAPGSIVYYLNSGDDGHFVSMKRAIAPLEKRMISQNAWVEMNKV